MLTKVLCLDLTNTARTARHYVSDSAAWSYVTKLPWTCPESRSQRFRKWH